MAGYIPKEQLDSYQRWQINSFDRPTAAPVAPATSSEPVAVPAPQEIVDETAGGELVTDFGLPTAEDIERIHAEAREAGYAEGHQAGYAEGREAAREQAERMLALADNLQRSLTGIDQSVADEVLSLALEVASQVLRRTVESDPDYLLPIIREALAALPLHHGHVTLHINPADAEAVRQHLGNQFTQAGWHVIEDAQVELGGCFLRAGSSEVDATLATRWKRVLESIGLASAEPPEAA